MKILAPSINLAEYARNVWRVTALHGQSIDDFKDPESWAHVAFNFKRFDKVELIAEDGSFYAEGIVLKITKTSAAVKFYLCEDLNPSKEKPEEGAKFEAEWGGAAKWRIVRKSDGEIIETGIGSKEEALSLAAKFNKEGE